MEISENPNPNQEPVKPKYMKGVALLLVVVICYYFGYQNGKQGYVFVPKEFKVINQENSPATVDYDLLWDALGVVGEKYIDQPVDQRKILYGSIKGAVEAIGDPYTTFLEPRALDNFRTQLKGSFGGIGAEVGKKEGSIVIVAPLDDSPAERAGILAGDIVVQVDGKSAQGWSVEEAVEKIRGPKGTSVTLNLFREGRDKPFDVRIVRDTIVIKSVKHEVRNIDGKNIGIITLSEFGDDTKGLFDQAINEVLTKNVKGIVVDLRNNPGGYLQTSVEVASAWVKSGDVVVTEARSEGVPIKYNARGNNRLASIKTVVLINGGSASASEILAGALRDYNIAKLIGEKSFGKGSVQELVELKGGSAVKVTIAKWITPGGKNLNQNGLDPDIEVKLTEEDINAGKDPQMDKAIEELTK